jgi:alkanesulfonate monooxygenase SsuD/methylene tetrahydromethanopterin reductase-like flavin-dependent oxidoreductase (luciferase family)
VQAVQHKFDVLKKHCETVGRDYESIRRTVTLSCMIGETDEQAEAKVPASLRGRTAFTASALIGSPATLRKRLIELEEAGVQEIILRFTDVLNLDMLRFFARELIA